MSLLLLTRKPGQKGNPAPVTAPLLLIDKLDSAVIDRLGDAVKGKIIIAKPRNSHIKNPFEPNATRYADSELNKLPDADMLTKAEIDGFIPGIKKDYYTKLYLESKGALGLLTSNNNSRDGTLFSQGGPAYQKKYAPSFPEMSLAREDYLKLVRLLDDKIDVQLDMDVQTKFYDDDATGYNVVGEIAGTDPLLKNQVVMLGGHIDSWHPGTGATDNAAGCAVMMEAIRLLKTLGVQPRRTIRIALWGGEEEGPLRIHWLCKKTLWRPDRYETDSRTKKCIRLFQS